METGHPSTRAVNSGSGNRTPVYTGSVHGVRPWTRAVNSGSGNRPLDTSRGRVSVVITHADLGNVGRIFESVCLFVRSTTEKRMIPKCSNLVQGMVFWYPRSDTVWGSKVKGQGYGVSKFILYTFVPCILEPRFIDIR